MNAGGASEGAGGEGRRVRVKWYHTLCSSTGPRKSSTFVSKRGASHDAEGVGAGGVRHWRARSAAYRMRLVSVEEEEAHPAAASSSREEQGISLQEEVRRFFASSSDEGDAGETGGDGASRENSSDEDEDWREESPRARPPAPRKRKPRNSELGPSLPSRAKRSRTTPRRFEPRVPLDYDALPVGAVPGVVGIRKVKQGSYSVMICHSGQGWHLGKVGTLPEAVRLYNTEARRRGKPLNSLPPSAPSRVAAQKNGAAKTKDGGNKMPKRVRAARNIWKTPMGRYVVVHLSHYLGTVDTIQQAVRLYNSEATRRGTPLHELTEEITREAPTIPAEPAPAAVQTPPAKPPPDPVRAPIPTPTAIPAPASAPAPAPAAAAVSPPLDSALEAENRRLRERNEKLERSLRSLLATSQDLADLVTEREHERARDDSAR